MFCVKFIQMEIYTKTRTFSELPEQDGIVFWDSRTTKSSVIVALILTPRRGSDSRGSTVWTSIMSLFPPPSFLQILGLSTSMKSETRYTIKDDIIQTAQAVETIISRLNMKESAATSVVSRYTEIHNVFYQFDQLLMENEGFM